MRHARLVLFGICLAGVGLLAPHLGEYPLRVLLVMGIEVIMVASMALSNGFTGVFSLGHAGFIALGAIVGLPPVFQFLSHVPPWDRMANTRLIWLLGLAVAVVAAYGADAVLVAERPGRRRVQLPGQGHHRLQPDSPERPGLLGRRGHQSSADQRRGPRAGPRHATAAARRRAGRAGLVRGTLRQGGDRCRGARRRRDRGAGWCGRGRAAAWSRGRRECRGCGRSGGGAGWGRRFRVWRVPG